MEKKIFAEDIQKIVGCKTPDVAVEVNDGENDICVVTTLDNGEKITVTMQRHIPLSEAASMSDNIAQNIVFMTNEDGDKVFEYRPYMKEFAFEVSYARYYTDIDFSGAEPDLIEWFFGASLTGQKIIALAAENTQVGSILVAADEMIEYEKQMNVSAQVERVNELAKTLEEFMNNINLMGDTMNNLNSAFSSVDSDTASEFVASVNKLMQMDENDLTARVVEVMQDEKESDKTIKGD